MKVLLFAVLILGIDVAVGGTLSHMVSQTKGGENGRNNYICDEVNADILIFGSSWAIHHYNPVILSDSLGMTCYNCGMDGNGIILNYGRYQMICQRYLPKVIITDVYFCPHLPDAQVEKYRLNCDCRKPKLGMYERAVREHDIDLSRSYAIGDKIRDCAICKTTMCRGFLVGDSEKRDIVEAVKKGQFLRVSYAVDLKFAVKFIIYA